MSGTLPASLGGGADGSNLAELRYLELQGNGALSGTLPPGLGALTRLSSRGVNADDASARADAGRRAKDVLDLGRVAFLRSHGYRNARLVRYVDASVSPENVLVVATRD